MAPADDRVRDRAVDEDFADNPLENVLRADDIGEGEVGSADIVVCFGLIERERRDRELLLGPARKVDLELSSLDGIVVDVAGSNVWELGSSSPASSHGASVSASGEEAFWLCREAPQCASSSLSHGNSVCRP